MRLVGFLGAAFLLACSSPDGASHTSPGGAGNLAGMSASGNGGSGAGNAAGGNSGGGTGGGGRDNSSGAGSAGQSGGANDAPDVELPAGSTEL